MNGHDFENWLCGEVICQAKIAAHLEAVTSQM